MKLRSGLVSNSSSSSFCILGITGRAKGLIFDQILPEDEEEFYSSYGGYGVWTGDGTLSVYGGDEPYYIGLNLEPMLKEWLTLGEMKKRLQIYVAEKYRIILSEAYIELQYGECGN